MQIIKRSLHPLIFQTKSKTTILEKIFDDYEHDANLYVDKMIKGEIKIKKFPYVKERIGKLKHTAWINSCINYAGQLVRSQIKRAIERRYKRYKQIYAKCKDENRRKAFISKKLKELRLKPIYQTKYFTRPKLKNIVITLSSNMMKIIDGNIYFDEFIRIKVPYFQEGQKWVQNLYIPIKHHRHSNIFKKNNWTRANSVQIRRIKNKFYLTFFYKKIVFGFKQKGIELGVDQGYKKLIVASNGKVYGKNLIDIYDNIANKKQGSNNFKQALKHRDNETKRAINKFFRENKDLKTLYIEDLKNVKHKSNLHHKVMNKMQYWSYRTCIDKIEALGKENCIRIVKVNPSYTSQTCSNCGVVDKNSRNGEHFSCLHCGYKIDADLNASINIYNRGACIPSNSQKV